MKLCNYSSIRGNTLVKISLANSYLSIQEQIKDITHIEYMRFILGRNFKIDLGRFGLDKFTVSTVSDTDMGYVLSQVMALDTTEDVYVTLSRLFHIESLHRNFHRLNRKQ